MKKKCTNEELQAAYDVARGYSNLEYNVEKGSRGLRYVHVSGSNSCIFFDMYSREL